MLSIFVSFVPPVVILAASKFLTELRRNNVPNYIGVFKDIGLIKE
jgi:hypothetical protein